MAMDHAELRLHRTAVVLNHAFEEGGGLLWTCNDPKLCTTMIDSLTHFQRNRAIGGGHSTDIYASLLQHRIYMIVLRLNNLCTRVVSDPSLMVRLCL